MARRLQQRIIGVVRPIALGALILVLIPAWYACDLVSRLRSSRRAPSEVTIPRASIDGIDLDEVLTRDIPFRFAKRPLEFANPGFLRPAVEIFDGKYLADRVTK